jgi:LTXXQ motif family protein
MLPFSRVSVVLGCAVLGAACENRVTAPAPAPTPLLDQSALTHGARRGMNPVARLIARRDALGLTADQLSRLQSISNALDAKNAPLREQMRSVLGDTPRPPRLGPSATPAEREARRAAWRATREKVAPVRREMMGNVRAAMQQARAVLTPAQQATLRAARERRGWGTGRRG